MLFATRMRKRLTRLLLPLLGLLLLPAALLAASTPRKTCPAHFGNQALFKSMRVPVGRDVVLRCKIRNWKSMCGPKKAVRWAFNGAELRRDAFIPGFQVLSVRLKVAVFTTLNEGTYTCTLPNGRERRFNVTARTAYDSRRIHDLLPQNETDELPGRVYWLPEILKTQQRYVSDRSENGLELFMCYFYVRGKNLAVNWTFKSLIADEPMLLPVVGPRVSDHRRRPSLDIITRNVSCDAFVVKIGWRPRAPKGRCYTTYLVFRVIGDQEVGDYTCSVAGSDERKLSMNFKMSHNLPSQQWIHPPKKAAAVGKSTSKKVPQGEFLRFLSSSFA